MKGLTLGCTYEGPWPKAQTAIGSGIDIACCGAVFPQSARMVASVNCGMNVFHKNADRSGDAQWQGAAMNQARIRGLGTTVHRFVAEAASL